MELSKLQKFVEYKARWEGIPIVYIKAKGTSTTCPRCGCDQLNQRGLVECSQSGLALDRDINASINIAKRGWVALFGHDSQPDEAMKPSKLAGWKLTHHPKSQQNQNVKGYG